MQVSEGLKRVFFDRPDDPFWLRFTKTTFVVVPLLTVLISALFSAGVPSLRSIGFSLIISTTVTSICFASTGLGAVIRRRPLTRMRQFLFGLAGMIPGMALGCWLAETIYAHYGYPWKVQGFSNYVSGYLIGAFIFAITALVESREESETGRLRAQVSALTAQMNPHLLFNALNTVAAMIPEDPARAEEMTVMLADLYRGVLDSSRRVTHSLERELALCRTYLAVEQARYGARLAVEFAVDPALRAGDIEIPVLTVQPLVENAIRHGIAPLANGGRVAVKVACENRALVIAVEDDGAGFGQSPSARGAGTGILNCRTRLGLQYGARGRLEVRARESGGTVAVIEVPV